jgi:hypothetical protein
LVDLTEEVVPEKVEETAVEEEESEDADEYMRRYIQE